MRSVSRLVLLVALAGPVILAAGGKKLVQKTRIRPMPEAG